MTFDPDNPTAKAPLTVRLASPRGFCAGVERAVRTVEDALARFGAPIFVRHEIVHNRHVVRRLEAMGAVFVEDLARVPASRPVIFSAHGAPLSAHAEAGARGLVTIDATCPLVTKVHNEVRRHLLLGRHVLLVGHRGHPEVIGTMGQAPAGAVTLIDTLAAAAAFAPPEGPLAYVTQTTLSVDDTAAIIAVLSGRFPAIAGPRKSDICYATTNRQDAVKKIAPGADFVLVVGSPASSNSNRLVDTALKAGARAAMLVDDPDAFDLAVLEGANVAGVTSGASTPEELVERVLARLAGRFALRIETQDDVREDVVFKQPLMLAS
ncbi:MAG TPA: 4-hydroxy-3-methylbut-2-enyl diphosphate reductase [Parvularcula sp.]|nr:4-hydroxy-3-methylbut-2-enyl diphosphate reductase [Parvularcula sp.]